MESKESLMAEDWFEKADKDLKRVDILLEANDDEGAGFHLQQAAEKYLKDYLLGKGWPLKRTHDLEDLLNDALTYDAHFESFREARRFVTEYYIEERYPFPASPPPSREELMKSIAGIKRMADYILVENR
jgi:HEPN domain-containing protein